MSELTNLPDVQFADLDAQNITSEIISMFETASQLAGVLNYKLYPGDPRRLLLNTLAKCIVLLNHKINEAGKMNLLAYATDAFLDQLAALYGKRGKRLDASAAVTTIQYTLSAVQPNDITIPQGSRVSPGNNIFFATSAPAIIRRGEWSTTVEAKCLVTGTMGNDFEVGEINIIVDRNNPYIQSAINITKSSLGADIEDNDPYRERIYLIPESFSVAGPDGAYAFWAKSTSQEIIDVSVWMPEFDTEFFKRFISDILQVTGGGSAPNYDSKKFEGIFQQVANLLQLGDLPTWQDDFDDKLESVYGILAGYFGVSSSSGSSITDEIAIELMNRFNVLCRETGTGPGHVRIAPLMKDGELPTQDVLNKVYETCNDREIRPLTDYLAVVSPKKIEYDLDITYYIPRQMAAALAQTQLAVEQAVSDYTMWQKSKLRRDLNPDELIERVKKAGAKRLEVRSPQYMVMSHDEVAVARSVNVIYGGVEDGY